MAGERSFFETGPIAGMCWSGGAMGLSGVDRFLSGDGVGWEYADARR